MKVNQARPATCVLHDGLIIKGALTNSHYKGYQLAHLSLLERRACAPCIENGECPSHRKQRLHLA